MLRLGSFKHAISGRLPGVALRTLSSSLGKLSSGQQISTASRIDATTRPQQLNHHQLHQFNDEYRAILRLFSRSYGLPQHILSRSFHSSVQRCQQNRDDGGSSGNDKPPKPNKDDDKEKMMSVVTKTLFWMVTIYLLVGFLSMVMPNKNRPETTTRYVSWHEFVHHMLAVGEVKEVVVHPDMEMVTILLHDGAVIKGRRAHSNIFHMAVADVNKFEEKLRLVEKRLGIKDGVSVQFERSGDVSGRILFTLIATGVIIALLSRMRGIRGPISMDSFVSLGLERRIRIV